MFDLRQFEVLASIVEEGSLAGAAAALHYGQPTVAHHLNALEAHLGATLVERGPRGTRCTEAGLLFLEHSRDILRRLQIAENEVRLQHRRGVAALRIGTFATAGAQLLPSALKTMVADGIRLELIEAEPLELADQLRKKLLDCALVYGFDAETNQGSLVIHQICEDPYRLIVAATHRLATQSSVDLAELRDEGWIFGHSDSDPGDHILLSHCAALGFRPRVALNTDDYALMHGFVAAEVAVAVIPELGIDLRTAVRVIPTNQNLGSRTIQLAWPAGRTVPALDQLHTALLSQAQELLP